jgi:signal transduction histidine kinase
LAGCEVAAPVPGPFAVLALLVGAAGAFGVGWLLARARRLEELAEARRETALAASLGDACGWRSDADHRLQPGPLGGAGAAPWERFDAGPARDRLRDALAARAAVEQLALARDGVPWSLSAAPLFDRRGRFDGHLGCARPLGADAAAADALALVADDAAGAVWVGVREAGEPAAPWRVLHANAAARERFGSGAWIDDEALQQALPESLRRAWAASDDQARDESWQWRRKTLGDGRRLAVIGERERPGMAGGDDGATLSYTVSHDLRAPIRVVEGFTRILKEDYGTRLDRVASDHLDRVLGAAARMNQMIDAMLTLARLSTQPLARQPVDLSQLASWVVDELRRSAPDRVVDLTIEPGMLVTGDPTLLRMVLENLLGNAWKYSSRRPKAHISIGRESIDGRRVFAVRDDGAGFDMRAAERLFGLFQRLHGASDFPGTGVGLASVRRIVQRHGGAVWAEGEPDRGAAFFFTLREGG